MGSTDLVLCCSAALVVGIVFGAATTEPPQPQCPTIADRWATSESADAGATEPLITSPNQPDPPPDAGPEPWPTTVQLDSLDSLVGEWTSATGQPSPEATIRIVSDDPDEPRWKLKAWGESQWFIGCDVYRSLKAYCKLHDAKHRDVPLSLRGVAVSAALTGDDLVLGVDDDVLVLRRGAVASGRRTEEKDEK